MRLLRITAHHPLAASVSRLGRLCIICGTKTATPPFAVCTHSFVADGYMLALPLFELKLLNLGYKQCLPLLGRQLPHPEHPVLRCGSVFRRPGPCCTDVACLN